jgi:dUTP pyrophosphatase
MKEKNNMEFLIKPFDNTLDFIIPSYQTPQSAGADLSACIKEDIIIIPMQRVLIPTNLCLELKEGYEAQIRPRSGLAYKNGITILNSPATIDSDYRGEIKILLINMGQENFTIKNKDRIAQLIISPIIQAKFIVSNTLTNTIRSNGGFGSSGV